MTLQHLRSSTANKRPLPGSMSDGQLAINTNTSSPGLFFKDSAGALVKVGPVHVGTTAPNVSPASGGQTGNTLGEQWLDTSGSTYVFKIWDGSQWRSEAGEFVNASGDTMTGALVMDNQQQVRFRETTANGTNYIALQAPASVASDKTITLPDVTGTVVTTGDTGTVTSTMLLDGTIVNADVNASAAIAGTKIAPDFGSQTIATTGVFSHALGAAATPSVTFTGDTNTGIYSPGADQVAISTNGTGRLFVDASGNVGVGASPSGSYKLEVKAGAIDSAAIFDSTNAVGPHLRFSTSGTDRHYLGSAPGFTSGGTSADFAIRTAGYFAFLTGGNNERMRLDSSGRLGLGTSSAQALLDLTTGNDQDHLAIRNWPMLKPVGTGIRYGGYNSSQWTELSFWTSGSRAITVDNSQRVGIGTTTPGSFSSSARNLVVEAATSAGITISESTGGGTASIYFAATSSFPNKAYISSEVANSNLIFATGGGTERARIDSSGRLLVGTSSGFGNSTFTKAEFVNSASYTNIVVGRTDGASGSGSTIGTISFLSNAGGTGEYHASIAAEMDAASGSGDKPGRLVFSTTADGASSPTERMRIQNGGYVTFGGSSKTNNSPAFNGVAGLAIDAVSDYVAFCRNGGEPLGIGRITDDGALIKFYQAGTEEGNISVSGTTVSYNGAHLSRWSQLSGGAERTEILRGTVLSNIDEMCDWGEEDNEQLNRMKVSDVEGDPNVAGVFQAWDDDDDTYTDDFYCAMTGDFIIRIAEGVTVQRGDLLMSAGDGTAKPQDDDIIRSKTIAKVTSTHVTCTYDDGSYCVPCVLMAC
jgi:hypothetical protein